MAYLLSSLSTWNSVKYIACSLHQGFVCIFFMQSLYICPSMIDNFFYFYAIPIYMPLHNWQFLLFTCFSYSGWRNETQYETAHAGILSWQLMHRHTIFLLTPLPLEIWMIIFLFLYIVMLELVECPALWASGSKPTPIIRCLSWTIVWQGFDRRSYECSNICKSNGSTMLDF